VLVLAVTAVCWVGCDDVSKHTWEFRNESSYAVDVWPDEDQDWDEFTLGPGDEAEVELDDFELVIFYNYSPASLVDVEEDWDTITFVDE